MNRETSSVGVGKRILSFLKSAFRNKYPMINYIIFGVILLHLVAGFGWLFYKLEVQKSKSKGKENADAIDKKK